VHANVDWQTNHTRVQGASLSDNDDAWQAKLCQNQAICMAARPAMHSGCRASRRSLRRQLRRIRGAAVLHKAVNLMKTMKKRHVTA
jgi:hypothetical protein